MKIRSKSRNKRSWTEKVQLALPKDYPWKVLTSLTSDLADVLGREDSELLHGIIRSRDFNRYLSLEASWGLQSIVPDVVPIAQIRARYQLASLIRKFRFDTDKQARVARAKEIFLDAESSCQAYNHSGYKELSWSATDWGAEILTYSRAFLAKLLGPFPGSSVFKGCRHGPGTTLDTKDGNCSLYHKYSEWPYSCTSAATRYAQFAIATDARWFGALQHSYRERFNIPFNYPISMKHFWANVLKVVDGNRIAFVPKDAQKERTIAIEPLMNLYLQLGVDQHIRTRLKRYGVDLDSQLKNQRMARVGSFDKPDGFCTLDLSAASDSISLKLVELLVPPFWYDYLVALRSPSGVLEGETIHYEKISSMGNGYTFALESAIFTALIWAVFKADAIPFEFGHFAVFGDDLIVPKAQMFKLVEALRLAGFRLNLDKSFCYGPVRESCGADWFQGTPIRPVFLKQTPTDIFSLWTDVNRLKRILSLRWDLQETKTESLIRAWIPEIYRRFTGPFSDEDFDSYMHSHIPCVYTNCLYKYPRLVTQPRRKGGADFLFRKLMHNLIGPGELPVERFLQQKFKGAGSRFTVTSKYSVTVSQTYSASSEWKSEYGEPAI